MTIDQLERALDGYGGDLSRWPEAVRAEADALIAREPRAAKMAEHAARLHEILSETMKPLPVDAALIGRIIAGIDNGRHSAGGLRPTPRLAIWAGAAMIAFLAAGYVAGVLLPASDGEDAFASLMFGGAWVSDTDTADTGSLL